MLRRFHSHLKDLFAIFSYFREIERLREYFSVSYSLKMLFNYLNTNLYFFIWICLKGNGSQNGRAQRFAENKCSAVGRGRSLRSIAASAPEKALPRPAGW